MNPVHEHCSSQNFFEKKIIIKLNRNQIKSNKSRKKKLEKIKFSKIKFVDKNILNA